MARFCTRCGKPLEEGEVCSCTQEVQQTAAPQQEAQVQQTAAPQQQAAQAQQQAGQAQQQAAQQAGYVSNEQQFQQTQQAVTGFLSKMFGAFLNIIKHPVTAGRDMILAGDCAPAIALIVLQGIISTIFGVVAAKKIYSFVNLFMGGLGSLFGSYSDDIDMPYVKIIFGTLLISIALSFVLAVLLLVGNLIIKNALNFKQMLAAAAIRSCVSILATVVAIIVFLIHPATGILVFVTGTVWGFFVILLAMPLTNEGIRNKLPLAMVLVFLVFAWITGFSMSKGAQLYVPEVEDSYDFSDWLD